MLNYLNALYCHLCDRVKIHLVKRVSCLSNPTALLYPDLVSLEYLATGKYEPDIINAIKSLGLNDLFVDIGANLGLVSIQLKDNFDKFVLVEGNPLIIDILKYNIYTNGLNSCVVVPNPISDVGGSKCYVSHVSGNVGGGRLIYDSDEVCLSISTETTSLSIVDFLKSVLSIYTNENRRSIMFKIDIEGHELKVINQIIRIFENLNYAIVFENWKSHNTAVDLDIIQYIFKSGSIYKINAPSKIPPSFSFLHKALWCIASPIKKSIFDLVLEVNDGDYVFIPNGSPIILK